MKPDVSKKAKAQGKPERASGSKRVPTPPPPPAQKHWMAQVQDDRRIGQGPLALRTKSEVRRGNPGGASSSTAMPPLILEENPTAAAEFNDKLPDHKWIVLPAMSDPDEYDTAVAEIAARVAQTCRLSDNKCTMCFAQYSDLLKTEVKNRTWRRIFLPGRLAQTLETNYSWLKNGAI